MSDLLVGFYGGLGCGVAIALFATWRVYWRDK